MLFQLQEHQRTCYISENLLCPEAWGFPIHALLIRNLSETMPMQPLLEFHHLPALQQAGAVCSSTSL